MNMMHFDSSFTELAASSIHQDAEARQQAGWRYVQICAVKGDAGVDLVYSYMKDGNLVNLVVRQLPHGSTVASITDVFFEAFVCENEINDLFGIAFDGLLLDFMGNFYRLSSEKPMTIISPEQLAESEKQRKIAAAKAAKAAKDASASKIDAGDELEAKLAGMDPDKAAKVRAAMKAKAAKEAKAAKAAAQGTQDDIEADSIELEAKGEGE